MTPIERYREDLKQGNLEYDTNQEQVVIVIQSIYETLIDNVALRNGGLLQRLINRKPTPKINGLYLWGGVGRGKTHLVDMFFECLPFTQKKRTHFHRFMRKIHEELKHLRDKQDPITIIGERFADEFQILCFDEFIVNDIADAMILAKLLETLFENNVTLIATSNISPDELYKDGLQRDRFQPAINLIKEHTTVVELGGVTDYRLQFLSKADIYFYPHDANAEQGLMNNFHHIALDSGQTNAVLDIDGRDIRARQYANGAVWFEFDEICGGPRSQNDYIELARCFHTIVVSDIPQLSSDDDDLARRLINLIDIIYDRNVKFMGSGCCPPAHIYAGERLKFDFERTASRLIEMQSDEYISRSHLA